MDKFKILQISAILGLLGVEAAVSAPEKVSMIKETLSSAYVTNSALRAKLFGQYANNEAVSQAMARFRPSISADASAGNNWQKGKGYRISNTPAGGKVTSEYTTHPEQAEVTVSQNIFRGGGDVANLWASESQVKAGEFDLLSTEETTLQNAAKAYMDVIFTTSTAKAYELNVSYLQEQLKSKRAQLEAGEVTSTDVASSESELAKGMAQLATAQSQLEDAKANYLQVVGEKPGLLEYPESLPNLPKTLDEVIAIALKQNPAIINALYSAKQAGYQIDAATAALLPSIDVQAKAQRSLNNSIGNADQANAMTAQVSLTVPLYNGGGADYSKVRQQVESAASARYNLEQARKSAIENATRAWDAWTVAQKQITDLSTQVKAATMARDNAAKEADVGERSYTEVLQFQSNLITAEVQLEQARRDYIVAQYALYAVMGILTAEKLNLPVTQYDIKNHYEDSKWALAGFGPKPQILDSEDEQLKQTTTD